MTRIFYFFLFFLFFAFLWLSENGVSAIFHDDWNDNSFYQEYEEEPLEDSLYDELTTGITTNADAITDMGVELFFVGREEDDHALVSGTFTLRDITLTSNAKLVPTVTEEGWLRYATSSYNSEPFYVYYVMDALDHTVENAEDFFKLGLHGTEFEGDSYQWSEVKVAGIPAYRLETFNEEGELAVLEVLFHYNDSFYYFNTHDGAILDFKGMRQALPNEAHVAFERVLTSATVAAERFDFREALLEDENAYGTMLEIFAPQPIPDNLKEGKPTEPISEEDDENSEVARVRQLTNVRMAEDLPPEEKKENSETEESGDTNHTVPEGNDLDSSLTYIRYGEIAIRDEGLLEEMILRETYQYGLLEEEPRIFRMSETELFGISIIKNVLEDRELTEEQFFDAARDYSRTYWNSAFQINQADSFYGIKTVAGRTAFYQSYPGKLAGHQNNVVFGVTAMSYENDIYLFTILSYEPYRDRIPSTSRYEKLLEQVVLAQEDEILVAADTLPEGVEQIGTMQFSLPEEWLLIDKNDESYFMEQSYLLQDEEGYATKTVSIFSYPDYRRTEEETPLTESYAREQLEPESGSTGRVTAVEMEMKRTKIGGKSAYYIGTLTTLKEEKEEDIFVNYLMEALVISDMREYAINYFIFDEDYYNEHQDTLESEFLEFLESAVFVERATSVSRDFDPRYRPSDGSKQTYSINNVLFLTLEGYTRQAHDDLKTRFSVRKENFEEDIFSHKIVTLAYRDDLENDMERTNFIKELEAHPTKEEIQEDRGMYESKDYKENIKSYRSEQDEIKIDGHVFQVSYVQYQIVTEGIEYEYIYNYLFAVAHTVIDGNIYIINCYFSEEDTSDDLLDNFYDEVLANIEFAPASEESDGAVSSAA